MNDNSSRHTDSSGFRRDSSRSQGHQNAANAALGAPQRLHLNRESIQSYIPHKKSQSCQQLQAYFIIQHAVFSQLHTAWIDSHLRLLHLRTWLQQM